MRLSAPPRPQFDGFGGFEDEEDEASTPAYGAVMGGAVMGGQPGQLAMGGAGQVGGLGGMGGMGGMGTPAAAGATWGDVGMLGQSSGGFGQPSQPTIDFGQLDTSSKEEIGLDWGILTGEAPPKPPPPAKAPKQKKKEEDQGDEDEEFAVFDGFQDGRAVLAGDQPQASGGLLGGLGGLGIPGTQSKKEKKASANLSWDAERGLWKPEQKRSAFGSVTSGWDLRGSAFQSPASLLRIRSQAEDIFKSSVSDSLFTSPSMQRLKKQTDDMFASISAYVPISIVTDTKSFFSSWFG